MIKLVRKNPEGVWLALGGIEMLSVLSTHCKIVYDDGTSEDRETEPYLVHYQHDMNKVAAFIEEGTWDQEDLDKYGLVIAHLFEVPEGKRTVGEARYEEGAPGEVFEVFEVEDVPPPLPPPTFDEKMAMLGFGPEDFAELSRRLLPEKVE